MLAGGGPPRAGGGGAGTRRQQRPYPLPTSFLAHPHPPTPLPRHLPRCPAGSPACHGARGCRAGQGSNEQQNFIMRDEFLYIAKARPWQPMVTGSVRHASRAAGGAVKHLLHSHLSAGTGSR